jgi:hypothetical protein
MNLERTPLPRRHAEGTERMFSDRQRRSGAGARRITGEVWRGGGMPSAKMGASRRAAELLGELRVVEPPFVINGPFE